MKHINQDGETRLYLGSFELLDGETDLIKHAEGYLRPDEEEYHAEYLLRDHLGNTVVSFWDKDGDGKILSESQSENDAEIEVLDRYLYYPFGLSAQGQYHNQSSTLPEAKYKYNGKEKNDFTGFYDFHARTLDVSVGRFLQVDPLAEKYPGISPYAYVANNPLIHTDPTGRSIDGEYEKDEDGNWQKVSNKGDDIGVDFYHTDNTDANGNQLTYATDREGNWGELKNGRSLLQGQSRSNDVGMMDIFNEWKSGTGPEHSFFESAHPSTSKFNNHYLFKSAYNQYKQSGKDIGEMKFGLMDLLATSTNDWMQMVGSFNYQFVQLGDKTLSVVNDAKTRNSFYYKGLGMFNVTNYKRSIGNASGSSAETNTYQTYLFFRKSSSIYDKHP